MKKNLYKNIDKKRVIHQDVCLICMNNFILNDIIIILYCKHYFHNKCIKRWLIDYNNSCPICRNKL